MTTNNIGLKLADGEFYPVLADGTVARKRLVVTTVQDGQPSVQIDLYRGQGPTVENAAYIGSLVVEGIPKMAKGEPDIRMDLGLDKDGVLTAFAQEASTGASQSLKVSLAALPEEEKYEVPDFEFSKEVDESSISDFSDGDFEGTDSLPPEADSAQLLADVRSEADAEEAKEKPKSKTLGIILAAVGIVLVLLVIGFLVYKFLIVPRSAATVEPTTTVAAAPVPTPAPAPAPAKIEPPAPTPEPVAVAEAPKTPEPEKKATTFKKPGVTYKIKWGDTLWDLSYSYYRDPWVYMRIARANKIRNPDLIICGNKLWIPAKK
jgi:nucleoid-associated protein YgaU